MKQSLALNFNNCYLAGEMSSQSFVGELDVLGRSSGFS